MLELSWYGAREVKVPLGGAFHSQRLKLVSSQVGHVAPSHRATLDAIAGGWKKRSGCLTIRVLDALLAPPVAFDGSAGTTARHPHADERRLCQLIRY